MTLRKNISVQIFVLVIVLDLAIFKVKNYTLSHLLDLDVWLFLLLLPSICLIIPIVVSFFISSLLNGQYVRINFSKWLSWTLLPSLLLGLLFIYQLQQGWEERQQARNKAHNYQYLKVYGDERDASIAKAVGRILQQFPHEGDVRIKRMRVHDLDSVAYAETKGPLEIQLIYCLGESCDEQNTFASQQTITADKIVDVFTKEPITEGIGLKQYQGIEEELRFKTKDLDAQQAVSIAMLIAGDLVILKR